MGPETKRLVIDQKLSHNLCYIQIYYNIYRYNYILFLVIIFLWKSLGFPLQVDLLQTNVDYSK